MSQQAQTEFLTLQQAADTLNVSAQYVQRLLDDGVLELVMVGGTERLRSADVLALKVKRDARRRAGLQELTRLTEELGGYQKEFERESGDGK